MNYFKFIAEETRELMAELGVTQLTDLIGRTDLLEALPGLTARQAKLDLSGILAAPVAPAGSSLFSQQHNPTFDKGPLNLKMVEDLLDAVENMSGGEFRYDIRNTDRSVGARLSGEIVKRHGNQGMAADPVKVHFNGTAGQSFGVWNAGGLEMILTGDANDYVGKGMTGGKLVIKPHVGVAFKSHEAAIIGNTCLYGATGGKL